MDDLQSWWEVPSIAHFCSLFRVAFNLLDFDIEELEEALLTDGIEINGSSLLQELIVRLLNGCYGNNNISVFNYQMYLRRLFRTRCREQGRKNPFNTDIDFQFLPLRTKVEILHALCDFRLDADDVVDVLKNLDSDSLRVHPLGFDGLKSAYWYFYGTRLYREDYHKHKRKKSKDEEKSKGKKKGEEEEVSEEDGVTGGGGKWQVVCYTEADWERVTESLAKSTCRDERQLYTVLSEDFLPEIPRLFAEKERLQRKRLLEMGARRTSSRIEKMKRTKEAQGKDQPKDTSSLQSLRKHHHTRGGGGLSRSRSNSEGDSSDGSCAPSLPTGRQTNNSLSSATGQIFIQSSRRKLRNSHLLRWSREDLMTGLYKVLDKVKMHEDAWPFVDPVEEAYAPRYYSVIARPMDLQTMEDKLDNGEYGSLQQFKDDFQLIVDNCRQYNGSDNDYTRMVNRVHMTFMALIARYLEADGSSGEEEDMAVGRSDDDDADAKTLSDRRSESPVLSLPPPPPSLSPRSPLSQTGLSDCESVTSLSSRSSLDQDWKKSQYNYKKEKVKKRRKTNRSRLKKKVKRKEKQSEKVSSGRDSSSDGREQLPEEESVIEPKMSPCRESNTDEEERLSILDDVETSASEAFVGSTASSSDDEEESRTSVRGKGTGASSSTGRGLKRTALVRNAATMEQLDRVTQEVLKDITKWLDETPRYYEFSSNSNSPLHGYCDDITGIDMDFRRRLHSDKHIRPRDRFSNDLHRRKLFREQMGLKRQRTIDRLQPGKSKGNLLSKENLSQEVGASVDQKECQKEGSTPKISLGKVLATDLLGFGMGDGAKKEEEEEPEIETKSVSVEEVKEEPNPEEGEKEPETTQKEQPEVIKPDGETRKEKPTPNLSAWFKAFGAPKSQPAVKKKPEEDRIDMKGKEDDCDEDKEKKFESPGRRQRRTSTGSSVSERSSFSQDQFDGNSPRPSLDEPYLSPQPELKAYHHSPLNGTIKVGFYQDTCFPKEKSNSPKEPGYSPQELHPRNSHSSPRDLTSSSPHDLHQSPSQVDSPRYNSLPAYHAQNSIYPRYPPHIPYYDTSKTTIETYKEKTQLPVYPVKKRAYNEIESATSPKPSEASAFKSGSFTPTKEAVEQERTFNPTPGRLPTQGLIPAHLRMMDSSYSEERHYLNREPALYSKTSAPSPMFSNDFLREPGQQSYEVSNYNRVLSPYHMSRSGNHYPSDGKPGTVSSTSPINYSNSEQSNKESHNYQRVHESVSPDTPINYGKSSDIHSPGVPTPTSLNYPISQLNQVHPPKVTGTPYSRALPDLTPSINYTNAELNKIGVSSIYKNQSELLPSKVNYNHPISDLMQGPARYNYPMSELVQGKQGVYNQTMQLDLMQSKSSAFISGGLYNRGDTGTSKTDPKEPEYFKKDETKPVKKARKKKNESASFQQYSSEPKPAGSMFNFVTPAQLKDYTNYIEEMRAAGGGALFVAGQEGGSAKGSGGGYLLRPPTASYPPHPFINAQYQQLLQRHPMMLHQGLLPPPASYPPGYLNMHDPINRPSWL